MKILILNWRDPNNPKSGGAEIVTMEHARSWIRIGHQVTWFTSKYPLALSEEKINGVEIVRRGNQLTVYLLAPLYYLLSGRKFDIVIDEIHGLPFFTPLYVKKPIIAFIHEIAGEIWEFAYPFPFSKIGKLLEYLYFNFYKNISFWTDAKSTVNDLKKYGISINNCTVIPCAINVVKLNKTIQKEINPTFIFISRLVKMKGIEDVIKAFYLIKKELTESQLWIVGMGEDKYVQELKKIIERYGIQENVIFYGYVSEDKKFELLKRASLLLHASVKEGWGLVITEAASQATPSVVYDVSGLRDSVKDGTTGIVLKENTPQEMAKEAILLLRDNKRYVKVQEQAEKWTKSLTWNKFTTNSLYLIESCINREIK